MSARTIAPIAALLLTVMSASCDSERAAVSQEASPSEMEELDSVTLVVPDMACPLCARSIERHLTRAGVAEVRVDLDAKRVHARYDGGRMDSDSVRALVTGIGYSVTGVTGTGSAPR